MSLTTTELLGLIGVGLALATIVGVYMVLSRKNRWM